MEPTNFENFLQMFKRPHDVDVGNQREEKKRQKLRRIEPQPRSADRSEFLGIFHRFVPWDPAPVEELPIAALKAASEISKCWSPM